MPKRGQTMPWRVIFQWPHQPKPSTIACEDRKRALMRQVEILNQAARTGRIVETTVVHRDRPDEPIPMPRKCTKADCGMYLDPWVPDSLKVCDDCWEPEPQPPANV